MKNKKIIYLTIGLLVIVLLISLGTFAYWNWMSSENKNVVFNTSKALKDYITYNDGESKFVGDFQVSDSYLDGVHTTISMKKDKAANVSLMATINMDINSIGETMKVSPALKWVVTSGDSTNVGSILSSGNFIGSNAGDTMVLLPNIEVLTTEQKFTIWIWIDSSENPSADLTGETLDTVVWTQIDQVEGVVSTFSITRKSTTYQTINATVVNNTNKIVSYAVTTSNTEPSTWTSISDTDQSNVYNLEYTVSTTGTYYIWFKDSLGNVVGDNVSVSEIDTSAPVCTFGEFSPSSVANGETATVDLVCTDNGLKNINLSINDIEITGSSATLSNISKVKTTNGYTYTISLVGTDVDGIVSLTLPSGKIFDSMNNTNDGVSSGNLTIQNDIEAPIITLSANSDSTYTKTKSVTVTIKDASSGLASGASLKYGWSTSNTTEPSSYTTVNPSYTAGTTSGVTFTASGSGLTGDYYLWVKPVTLKDTLGNSNTTIKKSTGTFKFDNTAPTGTISLSSSGAIITATVSASDPQSGISEYQYAKGTSSSCTEYTYTSSTNSSYNFTVSSAGTYYVCVRIKDNVGNVSEPISESINIYEVSFDGNIFTMDETKTTYGLTTIYDPNTSYLTLNGSTSYSSGIALNKLSNMSFSTGEKYKITITYVSGSFSSSGSWVLATEVYNSSGSQVSTRNYSDTGFPTSGSKTSTLTISSVGASEGAMLYVWIYMNDAYTFSNYKVKVDITKVQTKYLSNGQTYGTLPTATRIGYTFDGWYTYFSGGTKISSTTTFNNSANQTLYAHWVDAIPPTVSYSVAGGTYTTAQNVTVTASDTGGSGYKCMDIQVNNSSGAILQKTCITDTSYTVSLSSDGNYTIYTKVYDNAGNKQSQSPENQYGWYYQQYTISTTKNGAYFINNRTSIANLSNDLTGNMYRYQGSASAVTNNYICFGTSTKSTCTGNPGTYMYRIIGIDTSGRIKIIKKEAMDSSAAWSNSSSNYTNQWGSASLFTAINGSTFLTNTTYVPSGWSSKIETYTWYYGTQNQVLNQPGTTIYNYELGSNAYFKSTASAKISIMYMHDYYLAVDNTTSCGYGGNTYGTCLASWIHWKQNDSSAPSENGEWTMSASPSQYNNVNTAWYIGSGGSVSNTQVNYGENYRPVFFLTASTGITSGTGTISDPYIIG